MDKEGLYKEIDLIQGCINRMSQNSFMLKGWALTVFAGVTAFTKGENLSSLLTIIFTMIVPYTCFWLLDSFFLQTEKKYRRLYHQVITKRKLGNLEGQFDLNPNQVETECYLKSLFSLTLLVFYGIPIFSCIIVLVIRAIECY
jgi:hypothetical protein